MCKGIETKPADKCLPPPSHGPAVQCPHEMKLYHSKHATVEGGEVCYLGPFVRNAPSGELAGSCHRHGRRSFHKARSRRMPFIQYGSIRFICSTHVGLTRHGVLSLRHYVRGHLGVKAIAPGPVSGLEGEWQEHLNLSGAAGAVCTRGVRFWGLGNV